MEVDTAGASHSTALAHTQNSAAEVMEHTSDPDAQAAITDFLDFTEYLPSDIARSFTLMEALEAQHAEAKEAFRKLAASFTSASLRDATATERNGMKASISEKLRRAVEKRALAKAEAQRVAANVARHQQKLFQIQAKLTHLYESFPSEQEEQAAPTRAVSAQATKVPKITLRVGGDKGAHRGSRVKRGPRITVPGEVLAPNEFDWDTFDSETERSPSADVDPPTIRPSGAGRPKKIKLKFNRASGDDGKTPKPRQPRPPGVMGTNVHSQIAGISTSNALAKLQPPPADAPVGSPYKPWGRLLQFELAKLRKRMKKNAVWVPSTTMVNRELETVGRSRAHYNAAKSKAEAAGEVYEYPWSPPDDYIQEGRLEVEQPTQSNGVILPPNGVATNGQGLGKLDAANGHDDPVRKIAEDAARLQNMLVPTKPNERNGSIRAATPGLKPPAKAANNKRKLSPQAEADGKGEERPAKRAIVPTTPQPLATPASKPSAPILPSVKVQTKETPVPPPRRGGRAAPPTPVPPPAIPAKGKTELSPIAETTTSSALSTAVSTGSNETAISPPRQSVTPILPPGREKRSATKPAEEKKPAILPTTPIPLPPAKATRSANRAKTKTPDPNLLPTPAATAEPPVFPNPPITLTLPPRRPGSRGKATSAEPVQTAAHDRPKRGGTAHSTPAPEPVHTPRPTGRRKRPAPGPVTPSQDGSVSVTVGKRKAAPRKKAGKKVKMGTAKVEEETADVDVDVDENGAMIDPDEPRYCSCNRVSFGEMIACENNACQYEWFHLGCVGLTPESIPKRTQKWYCPTCRKLPGIAEEWKKSEAVAARGKKK